MYGRRAEVQVIVTQTQPMQRRPQRRAKQGADFTTLVGAVFADELTARNHGICPPR